MEMTKQLIGTFEGNQFHYAFNVNDRFMINASDIEKHYNLNLSQFLEGEESKSWIKHLLESKPTLTKYKINNVECESILGRSQTLEDIILIDNGEYYFHKFLIYELCKPYNQFYWWIDAFFYEMMKNHQIH